MRHERFSDNFKLSPRSSFPHFSSSRLHLSISDTSKHDATFELPLMMESIVESSRVIASLKRTRRKFHEIKFFAFNLAFNRFTQSSLIFRPHATDADFHCEKLWFLLRIRRDCQKCEEMKSLAHSSCCQIVWIEEQIHPMIVAEESFP